MRVYLGLGSNLGDRADHLAQAVRRLARTRGVQVLARSSVWKSAPVGPAQPDYLNAALAIETTLSPAELLAECKAIERALGREPGGVRWGPRTLDVDLLLAEVVVAQPDLQVPHPRLHERAFALAPLCEVAPAATVHPVLGRTLGDLLEAVRDQQCERVGELDLQQ